MIPTAKMNITAVITTSASIIPMTEEAEERIAEKFLFPKISPIPDELERLIFQESKLITEGRKIDAITTIA